MQIVDGWLDKARHSPSPNYNDRPDGSTPELLVVHNISLPPLKYGSGYIEQFFLNRLPVDDDPYFKEISMLQVSAHLLIDRGGELLQFVSFDARAWHAGVSEYQGRSQCNDFSIGIELEGSDSIPYTDRQYHSLADVTRALLNYYPEMSLDAITGHSDIAPGRKTDPGEAFNWQYFLRLLKDSV
ncbi:MAG: 1,6-anhydro-N-acetylmuramyl-L-alanine amidase AmpD [Amphritea sp.]|nr:1,6-anhydro-N-acetylmuramyl-L-alanine amidase AmpD [Amphritea sp.]